MEFKIQLLISSAPTVFRRINNHEWLVATALNGVDTEYVLITADMTSEQ